MNAEPGVYETNVELGYWTPVPWYYGYFQAANVANCSPWELIDEWTPRSFWLEAALIVTSAEAEHAAFVRSRPSTSGVPPSSASGIGRR